MVIKFGCGTLVVPFWLKGANLSAPQGGHGPGSGDLDGGTYRLGSYRAPAVGVPLVRIHHLPLGLLSL